VTIDLDELLEGLDLGPVVHDGSSIGPGAESVGIELFAPTTVDSRWDRATWDGQTWDTASWEPVECEVLEATYQSGASSEAGILSVPDAGAADLRSYDPERLLDPLASESPFFGSIRPGTPVRIVGKVPAVVPAWSGFIDEARFELGSSIGRLRCVDGIALVAQAEVPDGTVLPNTLRARVRAAIAAVGLADKVPVQPDATTIELVPGGSFEGTDLLGGTGSFEDGSLPGWSHNANVASYSWGGAFDGSRVLRVGGSGTNWPGSSSDLVPVQPGDVVELVASGLRNAGTVNGRVRLDTYKGAATVTSGAIGLDYTQGSWAQRRGSITIPTDGSVDGVRVFAYINAAPAGSGEVWYFDAVAVIAQMLPGWGNSTGNAGSGSVAYTPAPDGARVLRILGGSAGYPKMLSPNAAAVPGATYTLTGWVRSPAGSKLGTIGIQPRDAGGGSVGGGPYVAGTVADTWELVTATYTVPADGSVATIQADCRINASSTVAADQPTFDAVSITGPDPATVLGTDPPVAPFDGKAKSAWTVIQDAALDALVYVWLDATGTLRFTPWGSLPDAAYSIGCDDGLGGVWLEGLSSLETVSQADAIRNAVRSWSATDTFGAPLKDAGSINKYGERRLDVARVVPNAATWAQRILDDRGDAGLEVTLGELRPYTAAELAILLDDAMSGPSVVRVRDDAHGELVDLSVAMLGGAVGVTAFGWRFREVSMIPRAEWDLEEPPPVEPPIPPPDPWHTETRTYVATSDALIALTSGGSKYGAGAATTLPVGAWSGWTYRSLVQLPAIPWTKVRRIASATLILTTSDQVRIGFGSSPTIELKRITGSWSAGSASSPSGSNAVVWPGPAVTGSVYANVSKSENATVRIRCDALVLPWAPPAIGGANAAQRGIALYPGSGSGADTSEFWPVERGGGARPTLELVLEVFD
jgi:hypothetical protein